MKPSHGSDAAQLRSIWSETVSIPIEGPIYGSQHCDVCIIGAGMAGLSTAYRLALAGKKVVLIDDGPIGDGQTKFTTAHLVNVLDRRYSELEQYHGVTGARLAAESHTAAIRAIERTAQQESIDCDFKRVDGYLFAPPNHSTDELDRELEAAKRTGIIDVEKLDRAPATSFDTGPCLLFREQAQFHPLKYLAGLAGVVRRHGGSIYGSTHAEKIEGGLKATVQTTNGQTITADHIVVATNTPINDMVAIHTKQAPYLSYVIGAKVPRGSIPHALYWDTADPFHYVRLQPSDSERDDYDTLIVGGEDHKTGQADDGDERFARLENWARERFPMMGQVAYRWRGQVMESMDGLAFIGRNPFDKPNVYICTGDSGVGMTHGTIASILITDLILGRENPWKDLYDPSRKRIRAATEFAKENANVALQYADWITPGEVDSADEVARGHGAILRRGMTKVAVYRDENGKVTELTAVCPHLKCIVAWNSMGRTWDCPCHGSQFDACGKVLNGPANSDLCQTQGTPAAEHV